jgi:hypothetical protein
MSTNSAGGEVQPSDTVNPASIPADGAARGFVAYLGQAELAGSVQPLTGAVDAVQPQALAAHGTVVHPAPPAPPAGVQAAPGEDR